MRRAAWHTLQIGAVFLCVSCVTDGQGDPPPSWIPITVELGQPVVTLDLTFSVDMKVTIELELLNRDNFSGPILCRTDVEELGGIFSSSSGRLPGESLELSYKTEEVSCEFALTDGPPVVATVSLFPAPNVCGAPAAPTDTVTVVQGGAICSAHEFPDIVEVRGVFTPVVTVFVETT